MKLQTLIILKIIKFMILFFSNMSLHWSENFFKTFFYLLNQMTADSTFIFSIPTVIKFDSLEISKNLLKELINKLPDADCLERQIDRKKFYFFFQKKNI